MAVHQASLDNLQMFQPGQSGNPHGRPRRALSQLQASVGIEFNVTLTYADKRQILESMLELPIKDIRSIRTDPRSPAFMVMTAAAIQKDISKGSLRSMDTIMNRLHGRPAMTLLVDTPPSSPISSEEARSVHNEFYTEYEEIDPIEPEESVE